MFGDVLNGLGARLLKNQEPKPNPYGQLVMPDQDFGHAQPVQALLWFYLGAKQLV